MSRLSAPRTRPLISLAGLLVAFYAFPSRIDAGLGTAVGLAVTALGVGLLGWTLVTELMHMRQGGETRSTRVLVILLISLVISFSLVFYLVNDADPGQVAGLSTRTDALYFTLSTMTTVGFGDVHAEGQVARALVCGLIVFNVVVVASLYREHTRRREGAS